MSAFVLMTRSGEDACILVIVTMLSGMMATDSVMVLTGNPLQHRQDNIVVFRVRL
jgi:hypothetical protein